MASTVMATTKITPSLSTSRKLTIVAQLKPVSTSKRTFSAKLLFSAIPSMAMIAASNPLPAMAVMEKAALFDFNLTLPAIAIEFLILMVALDKLYFTPLGNFMDERDRKIREELNSVKDTSAEVKELEEKAAAIMNAARAEVANALNKMKKETTAELEAMLEEGLAAIEKEMAESMANIEKERDEIIAELNAQIESLSEEIADKILPKVEAGVRA